MTFDLPIPPTTNNLFFNVRRGRARTKEYDAWITQAGLAVTRQRLKSKWKPTDGPVRLDYQIKQGRRDLGNYEKACTDLLVKCGVLKDDSPKYVRGITLEWADVPAVRVTIVPVASVSTTNAEGQRDEPVVPLVRRNV